MQPIMISLWFDVAVQMVCSFIRFIGFLDIILLFIIA